MKNTLILIVLLIFSAFGQTIDKVKIINDIRQKYNEIVKAKEDSTLTKTEFNYECPHEPEVGTITYYSDSSGIKLIEHSFSMGDHYGEDNQYFVRDGKLFFHFTSYSDWVFDSDSEDIDGVNNNTIDNMTEERNYFYNEKPVKCLSKNYKIHSSKKDNIKPGSVPNKEIECTKAEPVLIKFQKLVKLKTSKNISTSCLGE